MAGKDVTVQTIEPEFRDKLVAKIEEAYKWAGAADYDAGMKQALQVAEFFLNQLSSIRSKEELRLLLDKLPAPSFLEKSLILGVTRYLPQILRYGTRQLAESAERDAPGVPRGRPGVDLQQRADVIAHIGALIVKGCSDEAAKRRAAAKFAISKSTVQRIWDDRASVGEADFRSALKYISHEFGG
jgi:hypothetical protein